ncbi:MAG: metallophosphoesterase [Cyanobacteria bacterium P01_B01_bin.77]
MNDPILLAQVTDSHLLAQTTAELRGHNPWNSFRTVLEDVVRCNPDGLLLTGDLAEQGEREAYGHLANAISPLSLPTYWLPGNHDSLPVLQQVFQHLPRSQGLTSVDLGSWQLILLDSVLPHAKFGEGYLSSQILQSLQAYLQDQPHKPTLVALHHHPVPVGIDWVDQMQVQNAHEFLTFVKQFSHIKLVVFGHIHHEFQQQFDSGPSFYGCPSTYFQITSPEAGVSEKRSGFRLFWLYEDGRYQTEVRRIGEHR